MGGEGSLWTINSSTTEFTQMAELKRQQNSKNFLSYQQPQENKKIPSQQELNFMVCATNTLKNSKVYQNI